MQKLFWVAMCLWMVGPSNLATAMELDWSGEFRSEAHWVHNYNFDNGITPDGQRSAAGGYYIQGGGSKDAHFQTLFLRLKPKLVVNDNVYIKSEFWLGDPSFGFFGSGAPHSQDQRYYYSTQSRGSIITAQRFWAEILTDVGTVQVGRAPLNYGLGLVWNSGDGLWDRYESTGDVLRLIAKFGAFTFTPSVIKYSMGNNIGGACDAGGANCSVIPGGGGLSDYSLMFKYENPDEEFEGGLNFIRRLAGAAQDPSSGYLGIGRFSDPSVQTAGVNYNSWDIFGRKKFGRFSLGGELPITSGDIAGLPYKTWALALEGRWKMSESWDTTILAGHAPGQGNISGDAPSDFKGYYFNPNYKIALIMFNYQLANFAGPSTQNDPTASPAALKSPYDNPITNANYLSVGENLTADRWHFHVNLAFAKAQESAAAGQRFFNSWNHKYYQNMTGDQSTSLGWEMDYGTTLQWDETFQFGGDVGWFFPGNFYKFSNVAGVDNSTSSVFAAVARIGIKF